MPVKLTGLVDGSVDFNGPFVMPEVLVTLHECSTCGGSGVVPGYRCCVTRYPRRGVVPTSYVGPHTHVCSACLGHGRWRTERCV